MEIITILCMIVVVILFIAIVSMDKKHKEIAMQTANLFNHFKAIIDKLAERDKLELEKTTAAQRVANNIQIELDKITAPDEEEYTLPGCNNLDEHASNEAAKEKAKEAEPAEPATQTKPTLDDIKGKMIAVSYADAVMFPVIDNDGMPSTLLLPYQVVCVLRECLALPDDNSIIPDRNLTADFLKQNNISVRINYPKHENGRLQMNHEWIVLDKNKPSEEELIKQRGEELDTLLNPRLRKLIRYTDAGQIHHKECEHFELYKSYLQHFPDAIHSGKIPDGEQFINWYNKAIDDFARLREYDNSMQSA